MKQRSHALLAGLTLSVALVISGCGAPGGSAAAGQAGKLKVAATVGMVADLAQQIGKEHVEVAALMGPGIDPHLYKASQGDIARLDQAQIIFYNGLNLEGKMGDILVKLARTKPTVAVTEAIPENLLREPKEFDGHYDPHVWFDVSLWIKAAERVRDALVEADPAHGDAYRHNASAYIRQLEELHAYARDQIARVPKERRVLVTAHDAFGYFGRAYDIEVMGLQGISTATEFGLEDVQRLVDVLVQRRIKAVFIESSVPQRSIQAVVEGARARGHEVRIGGELFSDAMGDPGTPQGTYIGMVRHNVDTIVKSLQ